MRRYFVLIAFCLCSLISFEALQTKAIDSLSIVTDKELRFNVQPGVESETKVLSIYALSDQNSVTIVSMPLWDVAAGKYIDPSQVKFNVTMPFQLQMGEMRHVGVSVKAGSEGKYEGQLVISGQNGMASFVPIVADTGPLWGWGILFFIVGFAFSWAGWNFIPYKGLERKFDELRKEVKQLDFDLSWYDELANNYKLYLFVIIAQLTKVSDEMRKSGLVEAEAKISKVSESFLALAGVNNLIPQVINAIAEDEERGSIGHILHSFIMKKRAREKDPNFEGPLNRITSELNILKFNLIDYATGGLRRAILINFVVIGIGVFASLGLVLQQEFLGNFRVLDWRPFLILAGAGAAIDTAKRFVGERLALSTTTK